MLLVKQFKEGSLEDSKHAAFALEVLAATSKSRKAKILKAGVPANVFKIGFASHLPPPPAAMTTASDEAAADAAAAELLAEELAKVSFIASCFFGFCCSCIKKCARNSCFDSGKGNHGQGEEGCEEEGTSGMWGKKGGRAVEPRDPTAVPHPAGQEDVRSAR